MENVKFGWRHPSTHPLLQKLKFLNSSQKNRKSRCQTFLCFFSFNGSQHFVPNIFPKINLGFLRIQNRGLGYKNFVAQLLECSSYRLSKIIFSGRRCICVSETSYPLCLLESILLDLHVKITVFKN